MSPLTAASVIGPILAVDAAVSRAIHTAAKPLLPPFLLLLLEISADFRFSFPVSLSLLLSPPLRPFLIPFLLGLLFDLIFVGIVKLTFRRARPAYNHPSMSAAVSADHYSFPSGHASRVFFVAASVHFFSSAAVAPIEGVSYSFLDGWIRDHNDGDVKGEVVVIVWIWATVTAISRILLGRHYVLDVAAGACLGILEALFALRFLRFDEIIFGSTMLQSLLLSSQKNTVTKIVRNIKFIQPMASAFFGFLSDILLQVRLQVFTRIFPSSGCILFKEMRVNLDPPLQYVRDCLLHSWSKLGGSLGRYYFKNSYN